MPRHRTADADALAMLGQRGRLAEDLVAADGGDGQRLSGAVGRVDLHAGRQQFDDLADDLRGDRGGRRR